MPPKMSEIQGTYELLDGHEARLIRLEDGVQNCNTSVAETRTDIKYLRESLHENLGELGSKVDQVLQGVADLNPRLEKVEAEHKTKAARTAWFRKTVIGLGLTFIGAGIAKLAEQFVGH